MRTYTQEEMHDTCETVHKLTKEKILVWQFFACIVAAGVAGLLDPDPVMLVTVVAGIVLAVGAMAK